MYKIYILIALSYCTFFTIALTLISIFVVHKNPVIYDSEFNCFSSDDCSDNGSCNDKHSCICIPEYTTYNSITRKQCNYKQKRRIIALVYNIYLPTTGAERFYVGNYKIGFIKLFLCGILILISLMCKLFIKKYGKVFDAILLSFMSYGIIWTIVDFVMMCTNNFVDSNDVKLYN